MKKIFYQLTHKIKIVCLILLATLCYISAATAQNKDSKGKNFWLMFNSNYDGSSTLKLFITSSVSTQGTVSVPGLSVNISFTVTANTVTAVDLPNSLGIHSSDVIDTKGIHVTADDEVTVYGLNYIPFTTDAYLGLPTDALGTDYLVLSYTGTTELGIVSTANNTTVTITPSTTIGSRTAGVPYNITLNQGESYELRGSGDLTGSGVTSDKPIGVYGANSCANIPPGYGYCDHICEMLPPVATWGKKFGTVPLKQRVNGDTWRFLASEDNTTVTINGTAQSPINKGQFIETVLTGQSIIESDKPILACQYANGSDFSGEPGDPFMMLIPPLEQFLPNYTLTTVSGYVSHYINLITPNAVAGTLTLDGSPVPASAYTPIGSTGYSGAQLTVANGSHTLSASSPFGAFQYGFNTDDSYGYPGGQSFVAIPPDTLELSLTPKTGTGPVNSNQCFTALLAKKNNDPVVGVTVVFNVLGANGGTNGYDITGADGKAHFCYDGPKAGKDTVIATFGILNDTSYFTRTSGPPDTTCQNVCVIDSYRNKWYLCGKKNSSMITATGTVNIGNGVIWNAWGWIDCNTGRVELHAINPKADNCASGYSDSFVYRGLTPKCYLGNINIGAARWTSYCGGQIAGQGLVSAVNCGLIPNGGFSNDVITPARSGVETIALKATPNPVQNYTTVSYKLTKESKVNITVYNYQMQPIKTLFSGTKGSGDQTVVWDAKNSNGNAAGSGLYIIAAVINGKSYSTTVQVVK